MTKTTVSIKHDLRDKERNTEKYPITLVVRNGKNPVRFPTVYSLTQEDWAKLQAPRLSDTLQKIKNDLKKIDAAAQVYLDEHKPFDKWDFIVEFVNRNPLLKPKKIKDSSIKRKPSDFDFSPYFKRFKILTEKHLDPSKISYVYCEVIKTLLEEKRIGNALKTKDSFLSLSKFGGDPAFENITVSYLKRYEIWMEDRGASRATIGMYLRPLRTIFNEAIHRKIISRDSYPFGKRKYKIPTGKATKKHLKEEPLAEILTYSTTNLTLSRAHKYWKFLYLGGGMNPQDLAYLKYSNFVDDDFITFIRRKTVRTSIEDPHPITIYVTQEMKEIIDELGIPKTGKDGYIFPIMNDELNPLQQYDLVIKFNKWLNDNMTIIGKELKLPFDPLSMVARHSLANRLKQVGATTEYIQETLGHTSKTTTEIYLGSFTSETKKEFAQKIAF